MQQASVSHGLNVERDASPPDQAGTRKIGYARVSTVDQDLAPQLDVLREKGAIRSIRSMRQARRPTDPSC